MDIPPQDRDAFDRFVAELDKAESADQQSALSSWDSLLLWVRENMPSAAELLNQIAMTSPALLQAIANLVR